MYLGRRTKSYLELLKHELSQIKWNKIIKIPDNPNNVYESFFNIFFETYDKYFPIAKIKTSAKSSQNPWTTKGITKTSKKKQKLYEWLLKKCTSKNEQNTTIIRIFSKQLKRKQRKYATSTSYLNVLEILKIIKEILKIFDIIKKSKIELTNLPCKLTINKMDVYNKPKICYFNKLLKYTGDIKNNQEDIKF